MKHITFITTGQPTTNPRLIKEAETLSRQGYMVKVICCFYQSWAVEFDRDIMDKNPGMFIFCGGNPVTDKMAYYKTRLRQKICSILFRFIKQLGVPENAISRTHKESLSIAKKIKTDLFIAHNLGALPMAVLAARHAGVKVGYDAEDLHSGLENSGNGVNTLNQYIEEKYFPFTGYFTAASPQIAKTYQQLYSYLNPITINNVFHKSDIKLKSDYASDTPIKLFWFSQTIGIDRGIEDIVEALNRLKSVSFELHLLGNLSDQHFKEYLLNQKAFPVYIHSPVAASAITAFAAQFDIGLALEPAFCLNNDLALSNKIFTYLQSGLAVIASDTAAQSAFMDQYPAIGRMYEKTNIQSLSDILIYFNENRQALFKAKQSALELAHSTLNWETESIKFMDLINKTLQTSG